MKRALAVVLFVSACGGPATSTPPPASPAPAAPTAAAEPAAAPAAPPATPDPAIAACHEQAVKLGASMRSWADAQPGFLPFVQNVHAPVSAKAKAVDKRGVVLAVAKDGTYYIQGAKLAATDLGEFLDDAYRKNAERVLMDGGNAQSDDITVAVYVWADRDAPAKAIAAVIAASDWEHAFGAARSKKPPKAGKDAHAADAISADDPPPPEEEDGGGGQGTAMALDEGKQVDARTQAVQQTKDAGIIGVKAGPRKPHFSVRLLVTAADGATPVSPKPAPGGVAMPASEPDATQYVAAQLKKGIGMCAPIITTFGTYELEGIPSKQVDKLVSDVPAGLVTCSCRLRDAELFAWGLRTWFGAWTPSLQWIDMPKIKATEKRSIGKLVKK
jgi:hypothetical protein